MRINLVYITTKNIQEAEKIGRTLLIERLVACINILPRMTAYYWWDKKIEKSNEVVLILKTKEHLVPEVIQRVKELHSSTCPCVMAFPITQGSSEYLRWLSEETTKYE